MNWSLIIAGIFLLNALCNTQQAEKQESATGKSEHIKLAYGDTLKYDLGFFGDEEGASIALQPDHNAFKGFCSDNREPLIYCYTATTRFEGTDTVAFRISTGSDGSSPNPNVERRTLLIQLKDQ